MSKLKLLTMLGDYPNTLAASILVSLVPSLIQTAIASVIGYGLARYRFPGKNILFALILATFIIPAQNTVIPQMLTYVREHHGTLKGYAEADRVSNEELLELDVDLLIPAALGGVITAENAARIKAPMIIEAASSRRSRRHTGRDLLNRTSRPTRGSPWR